jgi:uncharacterized membrane protein (UPF0127 family)
MVVTEIALVNQRTGSPIAKTVERAMTRATRRRGLLGRDHLDPSCAMMIEPCGAVHTAFMRFAIDVVFLDRQGYAVKIVRNLVPWRIAAAPRGRVVVEMAAGSLANVDLSVGDRLFLTTDASSVPEADQAARRRAMATAASPAV